MKRFLGHLAAFAVFLVVAVSSSHLAADRLLNAKPADGALFVWGDSQTVSGLNLDELARLTGRRVYSAARVGAGVYDLLVFAGRVPPGSRVLLAFSKPALLRGKDRDENNAGLSWEALGLLSRHNYSWRELFGIFKINSRPINLFTNNYKKLAPLNDALLDNEPIARLEEVYEKRKPFFFDKQDLYLEALRRLQAKGCAVTLIEFPFESHVRQIENASGLKPDMERFRGRAASMFGGGQIGVIEFPVTKGLMYDYTHLNHYGATLVTRRLAERMDIPGGPDFYMVNDGFL